MRRVIENKSVPCYGCKERNEGCHSTCERYIEFKKGQEKKYADKEKNKAIMEEELNDKVYGKYRILDAKTGEEKKGRYFVLKLDAKDDTKAGFQMRKCAWL